MNANGNFLWARSFGGPSLDYAYSITLDSYNNVYVTGRYGNTAEFNLGFETFNLTAVGLLDVFVLKMQQTITQINDLESCLKVIAFPNPSENIVQLTLECPINNVELILTDILGKILIKEFHSHFHNSNVVLPNEKGVYFLTIKTEASQNTLKLLKK